MLHPLHFAALRLCVKSYLRGDNMRRVSKINFIHNVHIMRKLICITLLLGIAIFFNACSPGYVSEEPTYREFVRPARPGDNYIWRDNEWVYRRRTNVYVQRDGQWVTPNRGRTYVQGHWSKNRRGHYWVPGRWR